MNCEQCVKSDRIKKLGYSSLGGVLFFVLSLPVTYKLFHQIKSNGSASYSGILLHSVVFALLLFILMQPWMTQWICNKCTK
jgi:hypothetical protein